MELDSIDHCTLEQYVLAKLRSASIAQCAGRYVRTTAVPVLVGSTLPEAQNAVSRLGLNLGPALLGPAPDQASEHRVAVQRPPAGERLAPASTVEVDLYGNYRSPGIVVPRLAGLTLDAAKAALDQRGLRIEPSLLGPAPSSERAFRVERQIPAEGAQVEAGSAVQVEIWGGARRVAEGRSASGSRQGIPQISGPPAAGRGRLAADNPAYTDFSNRFPPYQAVSCSYTGIEGSSPSDATWVFTLRWSRQPGSSSMEDFCKADRDFFAGTGGRWRVLYSPTRKVAVDYWHHRSIDLNWAIQVAQEMIRRGEPFAVPCGGSQPAPTNTPTDGSGEPRAPAWVLVDTQVNPKGETSEFVVGVTPGYYSARMNGSYERWNVSETKMTYRSLWQDHGRLERDVTIEADFTTPPSRLVPGQEIRLNARFSHSGRVHNDNPGIEFRYWGDGLNVGDPWTLRYFPFDVRFDGKQSMSTTLIVPETSEGEIGLHASLRGCGACEVVWVYRSAGN